MVYELRRKPSSDVPVREFFAKFGLEDFWVFIRTNILGNSKTFIFTLIISIIIFLLARKYESILIQILSGVTFFGLLILQILII